MITKSNIVVLVLLFQSLFLSAQFLDITTEEEIFVLHESTVWGNGASFKDINHDGWDDITTADGSDKIQIFINDGSGHFISDSLVIDFTFSGQIICVLWLDFDNDHDEDLFVTQWGGRLLMFQNDGNYNFSEIGMSLGFPSTARNYFGASTGDVDRDGDLDLIVSIYFNPQVSSDQVNSARYYENNGDGSFADQTAQVGLLFEPRPNFQPVIADFNGDLWPDVYFVIDRYAYPNEFFQNNGDGSFTSGNNLNGLEVSIDAMSATIGDMDNDLDEDVFIANTVSGNWLMLNEGNNYTNIASAAGVLCNLVCWGSNWIDYDNDGFQDLFVGATNAGFNSTVNFWFINNRNNTFTNDLSLFGELPDIDPTFVNIIGDINNDGRVDYYNNNNDPRPSKLWKNVTPNQNHFVSITLEGTYSHSSGIGSRIELYSDTLKQVRQCLAGESYLAQNSSKEFFGLGQDITGIDSLIIHWPRGLTEKYFNLTLDSCYHFIEGTTLSDLAIISVLDSTICPGQMTSLSILHGEQIIWNNDSIGNFLNVSTPGIYWADIIFAEGFTIRTDTIEITSIVIDSVSVISNPTCANINSGEITVALEFEETIEIAWQDSKVNDWERDSLAQGIYYFEINSANGCSYQDSVIIDALPSVDFSIESDWNVCTPQDSVLVQITGLPEEVSFMVLNEDSLSFYLEEGMHDVTIVDDYGCLYLQNYLIEFNDPLELSYSTTPSTEMNPGEFIWSAEGGESPYFIEIEKEIFSLDATINLYAGLYSFILTDNAGCQLEGQFEIELVTNTSFVKIDSHVSILNNFLFWENQEDKSSLRIYSATGQLLYLSNANAGEISLDQWSNQILFIILNGQLTKVNR